MTGATPDSGATGVSPVRGGHAEAELIASARAAGSPPATPTGETPVPPGPVPSPLAPCPLPHAPSLRLSSVSFAYPDGQPALSGVSFDVAEGETVALIGPNGAGKSTLMLHLNGILRDAGTVEVCGLPLNEKNLREIRRLVGLLFEDPNDQLFMPTVFDDVAFGALNLGLPEPEARARTEAALQAVGMSAFASRPPHHLSLGQRKRVALATVLVMDCRLLALDDPTGGLDPAGREEFIALLASLPQTKLLATHDLEMVWDRCDRVVLMEKGQVVTQGETRAVLSEEGLLRDHGLRLPPQAR